jgi:hypothetical protein
MAPPPNADLGGSNVGNVGSFWDSPYGNHMETIWKPMETIMETSPEVEVALKNRSVDTAGH